MGGLEAGRPGSGRGAPGCREGCGRCQAPCPGWQGRGPVPPVLPGPLPTAGRATWPAPHRRRYGQHSQAPALQLVRRNSEVFLGSLGCL